MIDRSVSGISVVRTAGLMAVVVWGLVSTQRLAHAQFGMNRRGFATARLITPPRSIRQILSDAERAIDEEQWSEAVVRLGDFLEQDAADAVDPIEAQDYFLDADRQRPDTTMTESLYRTARQIIGQLPARAKETYELQYGPNASRLLQQATDARDWHLLGDVRRKYFHTEAGYQASLLLARRAWQRGNALECALLLEEIVGESDRAISIDPSSRVLYALACLSSGHELAPEFEIGDLLAAINDGKDLADGEKLSGEALRDWISQQIALPSIPTARGQGDFPMLGARADRNGGASGQMPLSLPEWMVEMTASPHEADLLQQRVGRMKDQGQLLSPTSQPLRIDDQVLVRTTKWLIGIDHQTGKMVWTFPWFSAHENLDDLESPFGARSDEQEAAELVGRVFNDLPYGQMSSDGERLFLLEGLDAFESFALGRGATGLRNRAQAANTLVALELKTQGKLLWRVGADEDDASALGEAFFLGPPLPVDGRLYVMAEVSGDLGLFCLDPSTGEEIWRQTLGSLEGLQIRADPRRRMAGAMPTYHQGLLLCPTGNGLIVAIDIFDRSLRWGRAYARSDSGMVNTSRLSQRESRERFTSRWADGLAIASGNDVVVTPVESDKLVVLDAATGRPRFPATARSKSMYVAGIRGDQFYLVGPRSFSALSTQDGSVIWKTDSDVFTSDQQVCGRGVFGDADYLLPTSTNELIRISLKDGSVIERKTVDFPLGNLVAAGGDFFSQSATKLTLALGINSLRPVVAERLDADPKNIAAMIGKAKLLLEDEERGEALEVLRRAEALAPEDDEVRDLLVSAMLEELRSSDDANDEIIESLDQRIDQPEQRTQFLRLQVRAYLRASRAVDAIDKLIDLSLLQLSDSTSLDTSVMIQEDEREVAANDWIAARLSEAIRLAGDNKIDALNELVTDRLSEQLNRSTGQLRDLLVQFQPTGFSDEIRKQLFGRLKATRAHHTLERLALGRRSHESWNQLSAARLFMLAYAYSRGEMPEDASAVLGELGRRDAIDTLQEEAWAGKLPDSTGMPAPSLDLWPDAVEVASDSVAPINPSILNGGRVPLRSRFAGLKVLANSSRQFNGWEFGTNGSQSLLLRDSSGRTRVISLQPAANPRNGMQESRISGSLAILAVGRELIALDMMKLEASNEPPLLWRREISPTLTRVSVIPKDNEFKDSVYRNRVDRRSEGQSLPEIALGPVLGNRLLVLQDEELHCLDVATGQTRWRQTDAPKSGVIVADEDRVAIVSSDSQTVEEYDLFDGQKLASRPWTYGSLWGNSSRFVLAIQPAESSADQKLPQYSVRMIDPLAEANPVVRQWTTSGARRRIDQPAAAYGRLVAGRWMVLLRDDGKLLIWDIVDGKELVSTDVPPHEALNGLSVMQLRGKLIVFPQVKLPPVASAGPTRTTRRTTDAQRETIAAYTFSTQDGKEVWRHAFQAPWGVTIDQAASTPLLVFSRVHSDYATTGPRQQRLDHLAIDVRDGNVLSNVLGQAVNSQFNLSDTELTLRPYDMVKAEIGTQILTYTFKRDQSND